MSNNVGSIKQTTELTSKIGSITMNQEEAQQKIEQLFTEAYFNGGQDSIDDIEAQIALLERQISGWEDKLKEYEDQVKEIEGNIKDKSEELSKVIGNINDKTKAFEKEQEEFINNAITNAVNRTKSKNHPPQINTTFEREFMAEIADMPQGSAVIEALYNKQGVLSDVVKDLFKTLDGLANSSKSVMTQVKNTKATISLLTMTKDNMSAKVDSLYKNSNNDNKVPIYSFEKETKIAEIADKYNLGVKERDTSTRETNFTDRSYVNVSQDEAAQIDIAMKVVDDLAKDGFTFKEAMYAMTQLFPGLKIGYALNEQSGTAEGIVKFPTDTDGGSYTKLANKIKGYTAAGGPWQNSVVEQKPLYVPPPPPPSNSGDPISIQDGNSSYFFMSDDGNGVYDGIKDMLGYENGMDDFEAKYGEFITTNEKGEKVITGDALNNIVVMKLEEIDNGDGSVGVKQSFMSAADAGITEINLSSTQESGQYDINNNETQHTFNVTMNGKQMTAEQTMDSQEYIDAIFNNDKLTGEKIFSQLTSGDVAKAFSDAGKVLAGNSSAAYLMDTLPELENYKANILNYAENGLRLTEAEFKKLIEDMKTEASEVIEIAKNKGNALFNDIQGDYGKDDNEDGNGATYRNSRGEALNETIQKGVKEEIREKYETYGMSETEYEEYIREKYGKEEKAEGSENS